jgi:hypothetical protein
MVKNTESILLIQALVRKIDVIHDSYTLSNTFDNDCGHMWLNGTYTCFLIASSLVLISFLSF